MKIIYLDHSGFQVETTDFTMVFDYVKGALPEISGGETVLSIETLPSTDCGVAFLVRDPEQPGKWVFHAGDLNWWFWEGEPKQWLNQMKAEYCRIVDSISEKEISAAFVPLDPRLEKNAAKGPAYFLEHVGTQRMFPMHFWGRFGELKKLVNGPDLEPYREKIQMIHRAGESWELER